jgi:hypothetical protein
MFEYDETQTNHPMRDCIGKTIYGTGNSSAGFTLTFDDGSRLEVLTTPDATIKVAMRKA